jgi:hypothetical protein
MYQAIETKYLGPTNTRGARIVAKAGPGRRISSWDHALSSYDNHIAAARAYAEQFQWSGAWRGGCTLEGLVFVLSAPDDSPEFIIAERSR